MTSSKSQMTMTERLKEVASQFNHGVLIFDKNNELLWLNQYLVQELGGKDYAEIEKHYKQQTKDLFFNSDITQITNNLNGCQTLNTHLITISGSLKSVHLTIEEIAEDDSTLFCAFVFSIDKKRELKSSIPGYEKDSIILSERNNIIYSNSVFENLIGKQEFHTKNLDKILERHLSRTDYKTFQQSRKKLYSGNIQDINLKLFLIDQKKNSVPVWIRCSSIYDQHQKISRDLTIISDISSLTDQDTSALKARQEQKAILDNIPYLAWLKDNDGKYISVNEPFADFFDLQLTDIIGKKDEDLFSEDICRIFSKYDSTVQIAGKRKYFEDEWFVKGNPCWIETFTAPITDEDQQLTGITGIARDITDRKTMEDTIIKNEEHFRSLLQYSSDAITILDKGGLIMFESALRNRISDFIIDELIGKSFEEIVHPEDIHIFQETLESILSEPQAQVKREYRSLHKNKRWIYVESIFSNHLSNPSIRGIVVNTRDISDRKMSELKERVYHDNLVFLSNSALELLGLSGKDEIYQYISEKLNSFLGDSVVLVSSYTKIGDKFQLEAIQGNPDHLSMISKMIGDDPLGMTYELSNPAKSIENAGNITIYTGTTEDLNFDKKLQEKLSRIISKLKVNKVYHISMSRDNNLLGNIIILTLNKTIIKFKHIIETFVHQVSVALQRSQLEYELIQSKEKAEESDKLKTAFLANMSHEIRTPMNGILGFAEMLNDDHLGDGNRKKYVEIINNNGKMLMNLIDDIIDFAKIEAGQIKILQQEFSLNGLLTQVHSSFLSESLRRDKNKVKLRIRKAFNNEECYIQSDPNRLRQVLTNLVGNAFKFTKSGYIEFGYQLPKDGFIKFYVKDTGIGIAEDKIDKVFERFVQADVSRSRKYSGSGLGLAISKGFIELLKGTMWAESIEHEGSTFFFKVPYVSAKIKSKEEIDKKKPRSDFDWKNKLFLVAEDDTFSYKLLEGFLKKTNADIIHAEDGAKAVEMTKSNPKIDIILMDVQMPEMNGMEATKVIKEFRKDLPIIAQTANAIAEERQRCFEAGFDDFVTKPINITELFIKIDQWLSSK